MPSPFSFDPHTGEPVSNFSWQAAQRELLATQQQPPDDGSLFIGLDLSTQVSFRCCPGLRRSNSSVDIISLASVRLVGAQSYIRQLCARRCS